MNLDELQSVQARERQSSDLQHLRASFYQEVGEFIAHLNDERARAVEASEDPFADSEVRQLTADIETAEGTIEAIYERRVGKVVKKASIAAAGMPIDDDGLTTEEEALFEDLVKRIESNRDTVLSILDSEATSVVASEVDRESTTNRPEDGNESDQTTSEGDHSPATKGSLSAADLMGDEGEARTDTSQTVNQSGSPAESSKKDSDSSTDTPDDETASTDTTPDESETESSSETEESERTTSAAAPTPAEDSGQPEVNVSALERSENNEKEVPAIPRTTVRITADIGEIVGADDRDYDLGPEDVVTLPDPNAEVLIEKDAAERLQ